SRLAIPATDDGLPGEGPIRRAEWFQKMWTDRRTFFASREKNDQGALVFLGDSITQGWGTTLNGTFLGLKVANRGISGDTTRGVLIRLKEDVLALNPRGVVLLIGTNDLEEAAAPETITGNLKLILAALKQHNPTMPVVLCNVFPSSATKKRPAEQIKKINQLYFAAIKDEPQVTVLDTWALFANAQGDAKPEEFPDLLHPNPVGYLKWAAALRPVFETLGFAPAWPDDFAPEPGFESLFNGRDLTGWGYADAPAFDGKTESSDGRYAVRNGRLIVTVSRLERAFTRLWTTRKFPKDFVLKLEFRASPNADSGVFVREPQLQVRDYLIAGPYLALKNYRPLDWNEVVVTVKGGLAHATCNGEVLVDAFAVPATGAIGLESDHGQVEYRRIRVQETR
ncbi:MAG: GDSL-type esterase/lipase family protein, partial [Verrucomicrobia bacterium]|nr:GDSL-type esterase/lipase family protein [Verrucomicrobiota bacterium]